MPRLPILVLTGLLLAAPAIAQTNPATPNPAAPNPAADTPPAGAPTLPQAISSLLSITYACRGVSGPALYDQADDMARRLTQRVTGDANLTVQFMKRAEDQARAACPNTDSCWRELMDAGTPVTTENAKTACDKLSGQAAQTVADAYAALTGRKD